MISSAPYFHQLRTRVKDFAWDIAPPPSASAGPPLWPDSISMYAGTKAPDVALGLLRFVVGPEDRNDHRAGPGRPGAEERRHHPRLPPGVTADPAGAPADVPQYAVVTRYTSVWNEMERANQEELESLAGQAGDEGRRGGPRPPHQRPLAAGGGGVGHGRRASAPALPTVALVGDSIRLGYAPSSPACWKGRPRGQPAAQRGGQRPRPAAPGGCRERRTWCTSTAACTTSSAARRQGLPGAPGQCTGDLREIVERLRRGGGAGATSSSPPPPLSWTTATPGGGRLRPHAGGRGPLQRRRPGRDGGAGVRWTTCTGWCRKGPGGAPLRGRDALHPGGYAPLAEAVADCVRRALTVHRYRSREAP